jgi:hypothetical protein
MRQNILMPIMTFMTRFYHSFNVFFRLNSDIDNFLPVLRTVFFVLAVSSMLSCETIPTQIGSDLLPSNDFVTINSTDTLSVWSFTMYDSSVPTNDAAVGFFGSLYDPYFGTTTTEFVSQIRAGGSWKYGPVAVDSVKLNMVLTVQGGSTDETHYLTMSEIADQIYTDTIYYSDTQTNTTGFKTIVQMPRMQADTINHISISLPVEFGEYLIRDTSKLFYSNTKPDFREWFKGLYFQMSAATDPMMVAFNNVSQISGGGDINNYFVLFMHDTANVSIRYYFILDAQHPNACYNKFNRDFSTADPDKKIEHINDYYQDTLSYLQALNGVYTKIVLPGLDSLKMKFAGSKISINKARISIPAYYDGDRYTVLTVPSKLRMRFMYKDSVKLEVPDLSVDANNNFFDGTLHKLDSTYYFNIPTYIQRYLEDKNNEYPPELEVYQPTGLKSVILRANGSKIPVRFEMTYTKF